MLPLSGRFLGLVVVSALAQLLPPPGDGEIRTDYRDVPNETEVWLTLGSSFELTDAQRAAIGEFARRVRGDPR